MAAAILCRRGGRLPFSHRASLPFPSSAALASSCSLGMMCKAANSEVEASSYICHSVPHCGHNEARRCYMQLKDAQHCVHGYGCQSQSRGMCTGKPPKPQKRRKKTTKRSIIKKLQRIRYLAKLKKRNMNPEQKLVVRVERAKKKKEALETELKKYETPPLPPLKHDPESLTPEELHYLQRLGYKHKNYFKMGVRGVFGGVILNMHLHWKKHQLVKVRCKNFTKAEIDETGEQLARLSGGMVIDVQNGNTIIMYRGKNYSRPPELTPKNTLSKRKALFKARYEQSLESCMKNIITAERDLTLYREQKAKKDAELLSQAQKESRISSWSDDDEVELAHGDDLAHSTDVSDSEDDVDYAATCGSNSDLETDSDSQSDSNADFLSDSFLDSDLDSGSDSDPSPGSDWPPPSNDLDSISDKAARSVKKLSVNEKW